MTEQFGPIGIGWYYETVRTWTETYCGETSAYVEIKLYVKHDGEWSKPISGIGGAMLLSMENIKDYEKDTALDKYGNQYLKPYHSDEAYKMATTDALSVAMKQLGVAADVYMGLSDSKYDKKPEAEQKPASGKATGKQKGYLRDYQKTFMEKNIVEAVSYIADALSRDDLTETEATVIINHCKTKLEAL